MINEQDFLIALEERKRLLKQDTVGKPGKYCYGILWTDLLRLIREMTGGEENGKETQERQ